MNRFRRPKSSPARGIGEKCSSKGFSAKSQKIASLGLKIAFAEYDPKNTKKSCFPKKSAERNFLKKSTFFLIPSNFDRSRRSISEHFRHFPEKKCPPDQKVGQDEKSHLFPEKVEKVGTKKVTKKNFKLSRFYRF